MAAPRLISSCSINSMYVAPGLVAELRKSAQCECDVLGSLLLSNVIRANLQIFADRASQRLLGLMPLQPQIADKRVKQTCTFISLVIELNEQFICMRAGCGTHVPYRRTCKDASFGASLPVPLF